MAATSPRKARPARTIPAPALLGVIGGGQLGRFFALAAQRMGYRVAVLAPDPGSPAMLVADERVIAPYGDELALRRLQRDCAAVTVEFESVPAGSVRQLESHCVTAPHAESLAVLHDRIREKRFLRAIGVPTAPFTPVIAAGDLETAVCYPGILKLARQSYDGKGQARVDGPVSALAAWSAIAQKPAVLERELRLDAEISVVLARGADGDIRSYPASLNRHRDGILELSLTPAPIPDALAASADACARRIAQCLDYVGVLAVELFVCDGRLLVNEIAPRPHNSGHYTLDACAVSQFEQQVRALCGLPLGTTELNSPAAMVNVLGDAWREGAPDWKRILGDSGAVLHLYGKALTRPRRKMGHFTVLRAALADAVDVADACLRRLQEGGALQAREPYFARTL